MKQGGYIGSVRFCKNLILLIVILAVAVPTWLTIRFSSQLKEIESRVPTVPDSSVDITALNAEALSYQLQFEDFYAPAPYQATERPSGAVYLTFDGAPSARTGEILAVLEEKGVKATFFVTGGEDAEMLRAIADAGHTLGMLSYSGDYLTVYTSVESYLADMEQVYDYIKEATGTAPTVFRFLGGSINSYNTAIYHQLIAEMVRRGFVPYDWNVMMGQSARQQSPETAAQEMMTHLSMLDRAVVSLPDDGNTFTEQLLPNLIDALVASGYTPAALDGSIKPISFAYPE